MLPQRGTNPENQKKKLGHSFMDSNYLKFSIWFVRMDKTGWVDLHSSNIFQIGANSYCHLNTVASAMIAYEEMSLSSLPA
jgi:hypothetical protein